MLTAAPNGVARPTGAYTAAELATMQQVIMLTVFAVRFADLVKRRDAGALALWLADARSSLLAAFVTNLRRDRRAVEAALATPWSTRPVDSKIIKLKLIKRSIYGRAGLELLRRRLT